MLIGACALAAGRTGYIMLNLTYFTERPAEITLAPASGISEHAAIVGMLIGWWLSKQLKQPYPMTVAALASLIGIGASIGCISNACAYGKEVFWTDGLLWHLRVDWPDAYRMSNPRLPTQILMAGWLIVCMIGAAVASRRTKGAMQGLAVWLALFSSGDFLLQFGRADTSALLAGLCVQQGLDIALLALAFGLGAASGSARPPHRLRRLE